MAEDLDLGENDSEEEVEFPPPERRIITQPYDLSVSNLVEQWDDQTLVLPDIQREYVWDNPRASKLIESLLLNIPIPVLYFAETKDARWEIFDGQQRIRSIVRFVTNEFALSSLGLLPDFNRARFFQLPERERRFLERRTIRAVVISSDSHPNMKFETFERLNTGAMVLNAQEVRNSLYRGTFNQMMRSAVANDSFREAIGTKAPRRRMVDEELVLRFFALRDGLGSYRPPLKRFLNNFMGTVQDLKGAKLRAFEELFEETSGRVATVLGALLFESPTRTESGSRQALTERSLKPRCWRSRGSPMPMQSKTYGHRLFPTWRRPTRMPHSRTRSSAQLEIVRAP